MYRFTLMTLKWIMEILLQLSLPVVFMPQSIRVITYKLSPAQCFRSRVVCDIKSTGIDAWTLFELSCFEIVR